MRHLMVGGLGIAEFDPKSGPGTRLCATGLYRLSRKEK
jgi:hypothetical protein